MHVLISQSHQRFAHIPNVQLTIFKGWLNYRTLYNVSDPLCSSYILMNDQL
jgi:hypothetical protein